MRIVVTGADFEENLGIGMIAAALGGAGHDVEVVPFGALDEVDRVAGAILARAPDVVGLSLQFQHRAPDFLGLARLLRERGFSGHITCGGQFPTLAWRELLRDGHALDTIVLHEGEETAVELVAALAAGRPLAEVPGLALLSSDGVPMATAARPILEDLDELPFPRRYRPHARHAGVPFIPMLGGRGCWGRCRFCSITTFNRDARARAGGGRMLRLRSPAHVAAEMALLWHAAGGPSIFCFHDDNFLLPRPADSSARLQALRAALDEYGVGRLALIGKTRPGCLTPELALELRELGCVRLYVGVENAAARGATHLGRKNQHPHIAAALEACERAGINACYNLLLFEPEATLADLRENVAFIRAQPHHPVNFCRAEPYYATPLHRDLEAAGRLDGGYLGWGYRIGDDATELCFRICAAAFRQRNFDPVGVANRYMSLNYSARLLERFYAEDRGRRADLLGRARELTRAIGLETAGFLEAAVELAETAGGDAERVARETVLLGLRVAAADAVRHREMDQLSADMDAFTAVARRVDADAAGPSPARPRRDPGALLEKARRMALGATLAVWAAGCGPDRGGGPVDPLPPPTVDASGPPMVPDPPPPPPDAGGYLVPVDPPPPPPDAGQPRKPKRPKPPQPPVCDPMPPDPHPNDPLGGQRGSLERPGALGLIDQWRDSGLAAPARSDDVPLACPPVVKLVGQRTAAGIRVELMSTTHAISLRWQAEGDVAGDGRAVTWSPDGPGAQIRVAVRSKGGVAVAALRATDVPA